jgi:hypothetical protein
MATTCRNFDSTGLTEVGIKEFRHFNRRQKSARPFNAENYNYTLLGSAATAENTLASLPQHRLGLSASLEQIQTGLGVSIQNC